MNDLDRQIAQVLTEIGQGRDCVDELILLVRADERERCAKLLDDRRVDAAIGGSRTRHEGARIEWAVRADECRCAAAKIREMK